ncbi:MAG: hypothetical protein KH007_14870, partial [Subdoligranulum variabile]|nr:hypothetical protein [Subdoligranulum variabile]
PRQEPPQAAVALRSASLRLGVRHGICVAKMLDNTSSIICAFGLAAAAPRSPYRHLELCGIALTAYPKIVSCATVNYYNLVTTRTRRAALANSAHNIYSCTRCIMTKYRCRVSVRRSDGIFGTKSVDFLGLQSVFHPL